MTPPDPTFTECIAGIDAARWRLTALAAQQATQATALALAQQQQVVAGLQAAYATALVAYQRYRRRVLWWQARRCPLWLALRLARRWPRGIA